MTLVRLVGSHRVWADFVGVHSESAFLVTDAGALFGRGYFPSVEDLAEVVDLAELRSE